MKSPTRPASYVAVTLLATTALYLASLSTPAINLEGGQQHYGWAVLLYGWFGLLKGDFAWFANMLLLVGMVALVTRQNLAACVMAVACIALGLFALRTASLPTSLGNESRITGFTFGYYLWMASFAALLVGSFMNGMASRRHP